MVKTIFLADDDADDRIFFEEALLDVNQPTTLTTATDGAELMDNLEKTVNKPPPPHLIFLDLNMPRKNGFECLREIRETPRLKDIPVVIFSTSSNQGEIDTTFSLGANCYVRKPNSHKNLVATIENVLALDLWNLKMQLPREQFVLAVA